MYRHIVFYTHDPSHRTHVEYSFLSVYDRMPDVPNHLSSCNLMSC